MVESEAKFETNIENYSKVAGKGIRVNSVNPGVIITGIFETAGMTPMQVTEYYEARMNTSQPYLIMVVIIRSFFLSGMQETPSFGSAGYRGRGRHYDCLSCFQGDYDADDDNVNI